MSDLLEHTQGLAADAGGLEVKPGPKRNRRRAIAAAVVVGAVVVGGFMMTRPGVVFAAEDQIGLRYGPPSDPSFRGIVAPGESIPTESALDQIRHGAETFYFYPTAAQTYQVSGDEGADTAPMVVVTKDGIRVEMSGQLYFALNDDPELVRDFHEQIGLANAAAADQGGWDSMIDSYVRPQLDRALDMVTLRYTWEELRLDADLRQQFEAEIGAKTQELLTQAMGGAYFCGSAAQECSPFTFGLDRLKPMNEELSTVTEDQARTQAELASVQEQIAVLGVDGYLAKLQNETLQKAIDSGKVSVYVVPQGSSVPLPAGAVPAQ